MPKAPLDFSATSEEVLDFSATSELVEPESTPDVSMTQEERNAEFGANTEPPALNTEFLERLPGNLAEAGETAYDAASAFGTALVEEPIQAIAGVATGGKLSNMMGPVGMVKRALVDVPIQFGAKELEDAFGINPNPDPWWVNGLEALAEQGFGEAATGLLKYYGGIDKVAPEKLFELMDDVKTPDIVGGLTAKQIEAKRYGSKETFTAHERTRGRAGGSQSKELEDEAEIAKELFFADPDRAKTFARGEKIQKDMVEQLNRTKEGHFKPGAIDPKNVIDTLKSSANNRIDVLGGQTDRLLNTAGRSAESLNNTRAFNVTSLLTTITQNKAVIERAIGKGGYKATLARINKARTSMDKQIVKERVQNKFTGGADYIPKEVLSPTVHDSITGKEFWEISEGLLSEFSDNKQRGVFLNKLWGGFEAAADGAKGQGADDFIRQYTGAHNGYIAISQMKNTKGYKAMLDPSETSIREIFKDPDLFDSVVEVSSHQFPELTNMLPTLLDQFAMKEMVNPITREVDFSLVANFVEEFGRDNIKRVLGKERLESFDVIGSTAHLLEQSRRIKNIARAVTGGASAEEAIGGLGQNVVQKNAPTFGAMTRHGISGAVLWIDNARRKAFNVTDEKALQNAMMSSAGDAFIKTNMKDPKSYPLYNSIMRELGLKPITKLAYDKVVDGFISEHPPFTGDPKAEVYTPQEAPEVE